MEADLLHRLPAHPPSEVEWEELLLRMELMPRALRVVVDEGDVPEQALRTVLAEMLERERWVARRLESAAAVPEREVPSRAAPAEAAVIDVLRTLAALRARSFAMVQRRGLEVWAWRVEVGGGEATLYQLLTALVNADVGALDAIRRAAARERTAC